MKIADFGLSRALELNDQYLTDGDKKVVTNNLSSYSNHATTFVGTMNYMSPERMGGDPYDFYADIWSLGLSIIALALGKHPFRDVSYWSIVSKFSSNDGCNDEISFSQALLSLSSKTWSDEFSNFLHQCLQKDPSKRLGCKKLLRHEFIQKYISEKEYTKSILTLGQYNNKLFNSLEEVDDMIQAVNRHFNRLCKSPEEQGLPGMKQDEMYSSLLRCKELLRKNHDWEELASQLHVNEKFLREKLGGQIQLIQKNLEGFLSS